MHVSSSKASPLTSTDAHLRSRCAPVVPQTCLTRTRSFPDGFLRALGVPRRKLSLDHLRALEGRPRLTTRAGRNRATHQTTPQPPTTRRGPNQEPMTNDPPRISRERISQPTEQATRRPLPSASDSGFRLKGYLR